MARVVLIGSGMVGRAIALDLARRHDLLACDASPVSLERLAAEATAQGVNPPAARVIDVLHETAVADAIHGQDLAVIAVPGAIGFRTLAAAIEAGTPIVDISFFPEDALALDARAREMGTCAVVDVGVAPGLSNMILGHHDAAWAVTEFECLVGGLPQEPSWPWHYKAPFSPADVVAEYLRPARMMEGGRVVVKPALSDVELVELPAVGTLEAFNTDGLRSLLTTMSHVPDMREKTLRWPGHRDLVLALRESGFLGAEPIDVVDVEGRATRVVPLEFTSRMLFREWALEPGERELTVMRVRVRGSDRETGEPREAAYELLDRTDPVTGTSSMARTTGYTCAAVAELILSGSFRSPGVHPGERLGAVPGALDHVLAYLGERGVTVTMSGIRP